MEGFPFFSSLPRDMRREVFGWACATASGFCAVARSCREGAQLCRELAPAKRKAFLRSVRSNLYVDKLGRGCFETYSILPNGLKEGARTTFLPGKIRKEMMFYNGLRHGIYRVFFEDVKLEEGNYLNDKKHGRIEQYHDNGRLRRLRYMCHGEQVGISKEWNENGALLYIHRGNGKEEQVSESFYLSGAKRFKIGSKNGYYHGECIEWDQDGNVISDEIYDTGKAVLIRVDNRRDRIRRAGPVDLTMDGISKLVICVTVWWMLCDLLILYRWR